jgi:hypothetical protein
MDESFGFPSNSYNAVKEALATAHTTKHVHNAIITFFNTTFLQSGISHMSFTEILLQTLSLIIP